MSLLNQVLRDLDKRHAPGSGHALPAGVRPLTPGRRAWIGGLTVVLIALAAASGAAWWWFGRTAPATLQPPSPVPSPGAGAAIDAHSPQARNPTETTVPTVRQEPAPKIRTGSEAPEAIQPIESESKASPGREPPQDEAVAVVQPAIASQPEPRAAVRADAASPSTDAIEAPPTDTSPAADAETQFRRGLALLRQGRSGDAEAAWRSALELDPGHTLARRALAGELVRRGERAEAERVLADGLKVDPAELRVATSLAQLQLARGARADALGTLETALPYAQGSGEFLAMTAGVEAQAGQHAEAERHYRAALRLNPSNAAWRADLAVTLRALGHDADARIQFLYALDLGTLDPQRRAFVESQLRELGN